MKKSPEQLYNWWNTWDLTKPLIERDSLVEAMKRLDMYPSEPMTGVYPDIFDPKFTTYLLDKKEFADLRSKPSEEDLCNPKGEFDTTAVQRLIARFMNPSTPYTSALLYHGVGVGKTCTAISVAESFLKILPDKKVFILAPPSVADNFIRTIFDVRKLVSLSKHDRDLLGRRWDSPQCTGLQYLVMSDMLNEKDRDKITKEILKIIKKRYIIMGYGEFSNYVKKQILARVPAHIVGEERIKLENEELYNTFSDHLMIIDEAHNLRDEGRKGGDEDSKQVVDDAAQGKLVRTMLERILPVADGMRLLLMTATPMYNIATELVGLMNLLILNDTKDASMLLKRETLFSKKGKELELLDGAEATFTKIAKRYVSYMRGENPYSFPLRLTPSTILGEQLRTAYPKILISKKEVHFEEALENILTSLPLVPTIYDESTHAGRTLHKMMTDYHKGTDTIDGEDEDGEETINKPIFNTLAYACNILYPDGSSGTTGWRHYFTSEEFGDSPRLRRYTWIPQEDKTVDTIFGPSILHEYAPKMATVIKSLKTCKGIGFVYSRGVTGGIIPFAIALERAGWTRVLASGHVEPLLHEAPALPYGRQCALCEHHEHGHSGEHPFTPATFLVLTGDEKHTPSVDAAVQYATYFPKEDPHAPYGSRVKAILGSSVASEGLDFKCIREVHLLDPWWHLNKIEQIIGRGVRFCSHARLPMEERTCTIYLHVVYFTDYETSDLYAYRLAAKKSIQIGILQRAIKVAAFDCNIHHDVLFIDPSKKRTIRDGQGHLIKDYSLADKQYSSLCDFMESCTYKCVTTVDSSTIGTDLSTFTVNDLMRIIDTKIHELKSYYQSSKILYLSLKFIKQTFFKNIPWELVALGLRTKLNNSSFIVEQSDGTRGTLELQNGYLVFRPMEITDPEIPIALRHGYAYGRLATHMSSPLLTSRERAITAVAGNEGTEFRVTKSLEEKAFLQLKEWSHEIQELMNKTHAMDLKRRVPHGMQESVYRLLQWMPYRFRNFIHIEKIFMQFYMDQIWTLEERYAVLSAITERRGTGTTTPQDERILSYLTNPEVFDTPDKIYGFISITKTGKEISYCKVGANPISVTPPSLSSLIQPVLEAPLNGLDGCAPLYGFHVFYRTKPIFKILNTEKLNTRNRVFTGSNCTITSNLDRMLEDIGQLYKYQKDPKYALLAPMIMEERTTKEKADPYTYLNQLRSPELCMYTEILLRAFQAVETGSIRWILSMVDAKRAVETKLVKGKSVQKFIFENSFAWSA
jgi:hypothetical protein